MVALKEVKIRGEIRTIVDYAIEMIQSPEFVGNNIHTGWLDARIASRVSPPHNQRTPPPKLAPQASCMKIPASHNARRDSHWTRRTTGKQRP